MNQLFAAICIRTVTFTFGYVIERFSLFTLKVVPITWHRLWVVFNFSFFIDIFWILVKNFRRIYLQMAWIWWFMWILMIFFADDWNNWRSNSCDFVAEFHSFDSISILRRNVVRTRIGFFFQTNSRRKCVNLFKLLIKSIRGEFSIIRKISHAFAKLHEYNVFETMS